MSTLHDTDSNVNVATSTEGQAPDATAHATAPEPTSILDGATPEEKKKLDEYAAAEEKVVKLALATLDPKDMTKKYAALGLEGLKLAKLRKASLKAGAFSKDDFKKVCDDLETLVKMRAPIKKVLMPVYVRVHLWVEAVKPHVPGVVNISYYQVANKFLPTLKFDDEELTSELRKEWTAWVITTVEKQLSDSPLSMKELDASIADRKAEIERAKQKNPDPEKELVRLQKEAERKQRKEREDSLSKISDAIDKAIIDEHADPKTIREVAEKVLADHKLTLPTDGAFNPTTATANDVLAIAQGLFKAGKVAEMRRLHETLGQMLKVIDTAMKTAAAA